MHHLKNTRQVVLCFLLACIALPLTASQEIEELLAFESQAQPILDPDAIPEKVVSCAPSPTNLACTGYATEMFARVLVQEGSVLLLTNPGPLQDRIVLAGCGDTRLWMNDTMANRDLIVNQLTVAEALNKMITVKFVEDPLANRCNIWQIQRFIGE